MKKRLLISGIVLAALLLALYGRALRIFEASLGADHPKTRTCRTQLDALSARKASP